MISWLIAALARRLYRWAGGKELKMVRPLVAPPVLRPAQAHNTGLFAQQCGQCDAYCPETRDPTQGRCAFRPDQRTASHIPCTVRNYQAARWLGFYAGLLDKHQELLDDDDHAGPI